MPSFVLHAGATVLCSHGGQAAPVAPSRRVSVGGQAVATVGTPYLITGCSLAPPPAGPGPCASAHWVSGATRVLASGQPLVVATGAAVCAPTGMPLHVLASQTRVRAT